MADSQPKRRRIIVDDEDDDADPRDDEDSLVSNPDANLDDQPSSDEEGEDLMEGWMTDYAPAPELDVYDPTMLTDEVVVETFEEQMRYRRAADEELDAEDERRRRMEEEAEDNLEELNQRESEEILADDDEEDEDDEEGGVFQRTVNLEAFDCPLKDWVTEDRARQEIKKRFRKFLAKYYVGIDAVSKFEKTHGTEQGLPPGLKKLPPHYPSKIRSMCSLNKASLEVSYAHLAETQAVLAMWLSDVPRELLLVFDEVLQEAVLDAFPHYAKIAREVHVRIVDYPLCDRIRDLRQGSLGRMIRVVGVVTRRTGVFPMIQAAAYDCVSCNQLLGPFHGIASRPVACSNCQQTGPFRVNSSKSVYGNYQKLTIQETPGSVPAGRVPRYKDVILLGDLVDVARPGEEVDVIGVYTQQSSEQFANAKESHNSFPVFSTIIDAISVRKRNSGPGAGLSDDDRRRIRDLGSDPQIGERIIRSIAPSIFGHRHVKTAVALSLFGGCSKDGGAEGTHRVRGDINVLLLGDPGTAKSQMLKYAEKVSPRSVYSTGKGASAVGLTAGVRRDPLTKEWTLEGGALVLADQGVCLIDEFDKMNEQDRTSIHEAMEQQTISVSKAGIVASLQARCAVIAAANPIGGRYDSTYTLAENVELTDPILQRFDILCVLQDIVDPILDEQLAQFVVTSHMRSHPSNTLYTVEEDDEKGDDDSKHNQEGANGESELQLYQSTQSEQQGPQPLDQDMLKKYIAYARAFVKPVLHDVDSEKVASLYAELRQQSGISGGVPIAVRQIESAMRMAESSARMHLRDHVREDDIDLAIKVTLESFLQAQKVSVRKTLQRSFRKYVTFGEESHQLVMHQLQGLVLREEKYQKIKYGQVGRTVEVPTDELEARTRELNIFDLRSFYASNLFRRMGFHVDTQYNVIVKTY